MFESPLTKAHREAGAELAQFKGAATVLAFGDLAAQVDAARTHAAVTELSWLGHVAVTGRHRARFVHAMCTCQVKALEPGQGAFGMFLTQKGRLVSQFVVDAEANRLVLELGREDIERTIAQVLKFRVADQVAFEPMAEAHTVLALTGPRAASILTALGLDPSGLDRDFAWRDASLADAGAVRVRRHPHRVGLPGFDLTTAAEDAQKLWDALRAAGAAPLGQEAWSALRVAGGYPVDGVDMDEQNVPLEAARLAARVDWNKGCYIGQEVVCMMNDLGQPNRYLRGVVLPVDVSGLTPGADLFGAPGDDKVAARLGTISRVPGYAAPIALAVVRRRFATPGTTLYLADGRPATVADVPLSESNEAG